MANDQKKPLFNPYAICTLVLFIGAGFCFVASQFYRLQILEHDKWALKADKQQQIHIEYESCRGQFFGKMGGSPALLVHDSPCHHLYVDAKAIPLAYKKELAAWLGPLVHQEVKTLYCELLKPTHFRKLAKSLHIEEKTAIEEGFKQFIKNKKIPKNALFFLHSYERVYPMGSLAGSLLHTLGTQEGERGPKRVPTGGLEKRLDPFLKGKSGTLMSYRTPKGRIGGLRVVKQPLAGSDVYLTLNPLIQTVVEEELEKAVQKAKAQGGWAVMMEPYTGEIMALAQYPQLDLLHPEKLLNDPHKKGYLNLKALTDPFEPGSIIKPMTMLTCLKAAHIHKNIFNPEAKIACADGRFPGRKNPIKDVHPYSYLNMDLALQKSSNIYMARSIAKVIEGLGEHFYAQELKQTFGLGTKTGLMIGPESSGYVPTPGKKTPSGRLEWSVPTPFSLAMGYNLLATSLQMTRAFAMIANGGWAVEPYLIEKIIKKNEEGIDEIVFDHSICSKPPQEKLPFQDCERIKHAMQFALNKGGTAFRAKIPGFTAAGKTATTEKLSGGVYDKKKHISTFVGFAPVKHPRFVCLIVIDEPGSFYIEGIGKNQFGGVCAAPSFSLIGQKTLDILGEQPDDPLALEDPKKSIFYPQLQKLEELYKTWNH